MTKEDYVPASIKPTVHFVFNASAAGSIKQAFHDAGCTQRVVGFFDDLSFGPIDQMGSTIREHWIEEHLGYEWDEVIKAANEFWAEAESPDMLAVAWVCRLDAGEYTAFLEFIRRRGDAPFRVIDATGIELPLHDGQGHILFPTLGVWPPYRINEARLLDRQLPLSSEEFAFYVEEWQRLAAENAPLRVVDEEGRLKSAAIEYYDDLIVSRVSREWEKAARVVGETMAVVYDRYRRVSDLLIWARVRALGEGGILELRGDMLQMRGTEVRRSQRASRID